MDEDNKVKYAKVTIIGLIVIALVTIFFWGFFAKSPKQVLAPNENIVLGITSTTSPAQIIDIKHQFKNGTHNYAGIIDLPNPCYSLSSKIISIDSPLTNTSSFQIDLISKNSDQMCADVMTPTYFKLIITGQSKVSLLKGTFNSKPIKFNVFEVPENEDIDNYDIYIKG